MPSHLKSLELHGYKTFASSTTFEFSDTITAIVGPNGSGKSNIADAIRWVLGEQSYSLLRGKKTEDMIFSGSEQRSRAGMASATIVFDNSDNWLPIDFSEVAITRRAYRDGENEYLLNRQRVRLRDVSELLAQSGLAERTYTIISQGLVDAALALKAEERRRLFEEAAGIGLYRSRREESLKRLDATRHNLERVQDILAELQPRLRSLERQARRTQEYEQIKADLRVLLREWYGYHWHRSQRELTEARETVRAREASLEKARQAQSTVEKNIAVLRERIQGLRVRLNSWHRQSAQFHNRREAISRDLAVTEERSRSMTEQRQNMMDEIVRLEEEMALYEERLSSSAQETERVQSELTEAREQVDTANRLLQTRQSEHLAVESGLQALRQTLSTQNQQQAQAQAHKSEIQAWIKRQEGLLQETLHAAANAEKDLQTAVNRLQKAVKVLQAAESNRRAVEEALKAHQQRLSETEGAHKKALQMLTAHEAEAARYRAQLDVLEQAENALVGYASGTRVLLQAAHQSRISGVRGALSSVLEVPAELETAITAALGEYVDAVILEDGTGLDEALDLLEGEASRGVLLPLEDLVPNPPLISNQTKGDPASDLLGVAARLVSAPAELRSAVDLLLGQVLVVRDKDAARRVLAGQAIGTRVVTLRGEVFHASGQILVGSEAKTSPLGRPRQRREFQVNLEEAEQKAVGQGVNVQHLDAEISKLRIEEEKLHQDVDRALDSEREAQATQRQEGLAEEKARRQLQWLNEQRVRIEEEISRGKVETVQIATVMTELEKEIVVAQSQLREQNIVLNTLSLDEYQDQLSHWNTRAAVAERATANALSRQQEIQETINRTNSMVSTMQSRLAELNTTLDNLKTEQASLHQAEGEVHREIEILQEMIDPAEAELEAAEGDQASLLTTEVETRQAFSQAEHRHAQARITLVHRQEALDSLHQRIEDDFGLVAFEYAEDISGPTPLPLDGMVEQLPLVAELSPEIDENIKRQRALMRRMGPINPEAQVEFKQVKERFEFLSSQVTDLHKAEADLKEVITELDLLMEREFRKTFEAVAHEFRQIFTRLFGGGIARLVLTDPEDMTNTGIDIEARLPGRREQGLTLLSGGERSLTAAALVFSLLKFSPTPFCVMDEVDAMLDEVNVSRFRELLKELSQSTQFVIITHNRNTVQAADVIYGVTMGHDSASQVISLKMDEVEQAV